MKKIISSIVLLFSLFANLPNVVLALNNDALFSVVQIFSYRFYDEVPLLMVSGSGSIISEDGLVLTNSHVITDENGLPYDAFEICYLMSLYESPVCDEVALILDNNTDLDLAILYPYIRYNFDTGFWDEIPEDDSITYSPVTFSTTLYDDSELPQLREEISVVGFPAASLTGLVNTTKGQVTSYLPFVDEATGDSFVWYIETDALVNSGNSGGASFDLNDRFVGVPTMISTEGESGQYGYIIPVTIVNAYFDYLVEEGIFNFNPNQYVYGETQVALEDAFSTEEYLTVQELSGLSGDSKLFFDIDSSYVNYDAIKFLKENKIISGYPDGYFRPDNQITRAELMKILSLATGVEINSSDYQNCFPDVKNDWYAKYVCYAKSRGWIEGYPDGTFKPGQTVNKAEAIKMILNTQGVIVDQVVLANPFGDVPASEWYAKYVQTAKNLGILEETGALYRPGDNAKRAGVSENIYRLIK